jgi:molybdopterin converting factor subunit 1
MLQNRIEKATAFQSSPRWQFEWRNQKNAPIVVSDDGTQCLFYDMLHGKCINESWSRSENTMILHVRLFARARDLAGSDALDVELPDDATVADLRRRLAVEYPMLAALLERSALAVADDFAEDARVLRANDEIALLPPVSGGAASKSVMEKEA